MQTSRTLQNATSSRPPAALRVAGDEPEVLSRILDPAVNLSLWQRPVQADIAGELASLHAASLPDLRCVTSRASFDRDIGALLGKQGLDPAVFTAWRLDLGRIASLFFDLSDERNVTLRLETTDSDGCRRFHVDRTKLRLLCSYRGPGTEWLDNAQVDRAALSNFEPNEHIIREGAPSRFEPFWVGILKGESFPGNAGRGLVHRSPQISGSGQMRVLFCLDC